MRNLLTTRSIRFCFLLFFSAYQLVHAEGTKELTNNSSADINNFKIALWNTTNQATRKTGTFFSTAEPNFRLNIRVCNLNEVINLGFNIQNNSSTFFRLRKPDGTTVNFNSATPALGVGSPVLVDQDAGALFCYSVPNTGAGRIAGFADAAAGPLPAAGGYTPLQHIADQVGDYYIEFNPTSATVTTQSQRRFEFFDITVWNNNTAKAPILGRLWSYTWDIAGDQSYREFAAELFVYTKDSIVTAVDFNRMRPINFVITANSTGCTSTGNPGIDRKSRVGNINYPEYKIFLNDPDPSCFPERQFGCIDGPVTVTGCNPNARCINLKVTKPGKVEVLLDLDKTAPFHVGFDQNSRDRTFLLDVVAGDNCIPWDSRDGQGNIVIPNVTIDIEVNYFNGNTHIPMFDAENHEFGYSVRLVRPAAFATCTGANNSIRVYWDDVAPTTTSAPGYTGGPIIDAAPAVSLDGLTNLFGCDASSSSCHRWLNRGENACFPNCSETMNTWWYANIITAKTSYSIATTTVDANRLNPIGELNDTTVCSNINAIPLHASISGEVSTGTWTTNGDGTFGSTSSLNTTYTFGPTDKTNPNLKLFLTSTMGSCGQSKDSLMIHINPGPDVTGITPLPQCKTNPVVQLNGTIGGSTSTFEWVASVPGGIFVPNAQTVNATYQPSNAILTAPGTSVIKLTLTSLTNSGSIACPIDTSSIFITLNSAPTVNAADRPNICVTNNSIALTGTITGGTAHTISWTGNGAFIGGSTLTPMYIPTTAEKNAGLAKVVLHVTQTAPVSCSEAVDTATITFSSPPTVSAGLDGSYCRNRTDTIALSGSASAGTLTWSCLDCVDGSFVGAVNTVNAVYNPGTSDLALPSLRFVLTSVAGTCPPVKDTLVISPNNPTTVSLGNDTIVCDNNPCIDLKAKITGSGTGVWQSLIGNGSIAPSNSSANITYCLDAVDLAAEIAILSYTIPDDGNCLSSEDKILILVQKAAKPFAGVDKVVCFNNPIDTLNDATGIGTVSWSGGTGTFNFNPPFSTKNPQYTLSNAEVLAGSATLIMSLTTTLCSAEFDTIVIRVTPTPTVNAGPDQSICVNNNTVNLSGFVSTGTPKWTVVSGVAGTFGNSNSLSTTFTPSSTPTAGATTTLRLTTNENGCNAVSDLLVITYTPSPVVTITSSTTDDACKTNPNVDVTANFTAPATGLRWDIVSGSGSFSPSNTALTATYIPSAADLLAGTAVVRASSTGNGNCNAVNSAATVTITYINPPVANAGPNQTLCENSNSSVSLSGSFTPSTVTGQLWISSSGCNTCFSNTSLLNPTYTPSLSDISNGSVVLTLASTGGPEGCLPVQDTMTIRFNKAPTVNAGPDLVVCTNQNTVALSGSTTNSPSLTWSIVTGTGSISPLTTANTVYSITATDKSNGLVTLRLRANGNTGCQFVTDDVNISFTELPTVNAGPDRTVCLSDLPPIQLDGSGASGTWSTGTAGAFNSATLPNATFTPASLVAGNITFTYSVGAIGACPGVTDNVTYTLIPGPTLSLTTENLCTFGDDRVLTTATTSTGSGFWTTAGTGTFVNPAILGATYIPSPAEIDAGSAKVYFETSLNGFCSPKRDSITIQITDLALSAGPDQNICGTPVSFNLHPVVLVNKVDLSNQVSWTAPGFTVSPAPAYTVTAGNTTGSFVFTANLPAQGVCPPLTDNVTITFTAAPSVSITSAPANACETATSINLTGSITGVVTAGVWGTTNGTGTFAPSLVFNSAQTSVQYIPSPADKNLSSIIFTLTSDNNLCGAIPTTVTVTLNEQPDVDAGPDQVLCSNNNVSTIAGSITNVATGTWKSSSGCVACFTAGTAFPAANRYDADTTDITNGFVTLTLTSAPNLACPADSDKVVITYTPAPDVNAGPDRTICANNRTINLSGTVNAPFTAVWSGGTPASFSSVSSLTSTYTASNADTTAGTVNIILTSATNGLCIPDDDTLVLTITNAPIVTVGADQSACADTFFVKLNANSNLTANPTGLWTTNGTGTFLNINAASDTAVYVPSAAERNSAPVTVKLKFTTTEGYCKAVADSMDLTITPAPTISITNGDNTSICANQNTIALGVTLNASATGVIWSTSGSGTFNNNISTTPIYTFSNLDKSAGSVTLTARTTGNGKCFSAQDQFVISIQAMPVVNAGADVSICQDAASVSLADASVLNASGGTWTTSGTGVFGITANSVTGTYFPSSCCFATLDTAQASLTLTLTSTGNGLCPAVSDTRVISLTKLPRVNAGPDVTICADNLTTTLSATSIRSSGISWSSPDGGTFAPSTFIANPSYSPTGVGTFRVVATASGTGTCGSVRDTALVTVRPTPVIDLGLDANICSVDENATLTFEVGSLSLTNATGVIWSSNTNPTGTSFNLSNPLMPIYTVSAQDISNGQVTIFAITTTGIGTCAPVGDQMTVFIDKAPTVTIGPDISICENTGSVPLGLNATLTNVSVGSWSSPVLSAFFSDPNKISPTLTVSDPNDDDNGDQVEVIFTTSAVGACLPDADTMIVRYTNSPTLNAGPNQDFCFSAPGETLNIQVNGGVAGTWSIISGDGISPTSFFTSANLPNPIYTPSAGAVTNGNVITLRFTPSDICYLGATDDVVITLHQNPFLTTPAASNICETTGSVSLGTTTNYVGGVQWSVLQGFGSMSTLTGTNPTYTVSPLDKNISQVTILVSSNTLTGICAPDIDTITFRVIPAPLVNAGPDQTVCADLLNVSNAIHLNASSTNAASLSWSSGQGSFSNAASATSNFTATAFNATLTLTAIGNAPCANRTDDVIVSSVNTPVVVTLSNKDTCAQLSPLNLASVVPAGSQSGYTTAIWSKVPGNASGSFVPNTTTINGKYIPTAADTTRGFIDLVLTATNTGVCSNSYDDTVRFVLHRQPQVTGGADLFYCAQVKDIPVTGTLSGITTIVWETAGSGSFTPTSTLNTVYTLSSADSLAGGTPIWIRTDNVSGGVPCPDDSDFVSINLSPAPVAIVNAGFDQYLCHDNTTAQLNGIILNAAGGLWKIVKGSGSLSSSTALDAVYQFSIADKTADTVILSLESVGQDNLCLPVIDTILILFTPTPEVFAGATSAVCASDPIIQLGDSITQASIGQGKWTVFGGDGVFTPSEFDLNAQYIPGPNDINAGQVGFQLTATVNGTCIGTYTADTLSIIRPYNKATSNANNAVCANNTGILLNGISSTGTGVWSIISEDGSSTPIAPANVNTFFVPGSEDMINQMASLQFKTTGTTCDPDSITVLVSINPAPTVTAPPDLTVCADVISGGTPVSGQITVASNGIWRTRGTGTFTGVTTTVAGTVTVSAFYIPSSADTAAGSVELILQSTDNLSGGALCNSEDDTLVLNFMPRPVVSANPANTCTTINGVQITGSVSQDPVYYPNSTGMWIVASGSGTIAPDPFSATAEYYPSAAELAAVPKLITLVWASQNAGTCNPVTDTIQLYVNSPVANAGPNHFTCNLAPVTLTAIQTPNASSFQWSLVGGIPGSAGTGKSITVNTGGDYVLTMTDIFGCQALDTMNVEDYNPPAAFSIPVDTCYDYYMFVSLHTQDLLHPLGNFQWKFNNVVMSGETNDSVRVHSPGNYSLQYNLDACKIGYDSTIVFDIPRVLSPDVIGCSNSTVIALVTQVNSPPASEIQTYVWTNQANATVSNSNPATVATYTGSGIDSTYVYVSFTDGNGCSNRDSVNVISIPKPRPALPTDSMACAFTPILLDGSLLPQSNVDSLRIFHPTYEWYEKDSPLFILDRDTILSTATTGNYVFKVTVGQCTGDDTTQLTFQPYPVRVLPSDKTLCMDRALSTLLDAGPGITTPNPAFTSVTYQWSGQGATAADTNRIFTVLLEDFESIHSEDNEYVVTIANNYGLLVCDTTDRIIVHDVCAPRVFPPTAFHPGDDNFMDGFFTVQNRYVGKYELRVFNRWGEIIFQTNDRNEHWDGTYRGEPMPIGVYAWTIVYEGKDDEYIGPFRKEGRVVLIR